MQELGDRFDDELWLVDLLDVRGARYEHERPRRRNRVNHLLVALDLEGQTQ